jgi:hypothetical protein
MGAQNFGWLPPETWHHMVLHNSLQMAAVLNWSSTL